ncbi:MAG: proprotein convertase P-domain-containing protein, partial [Saprospiraceae bacterium]
FFDKRDESAPLICFSLAFYVCSNYTIQASAANTSGCLYIVFLSDGSKERSGWEAVMDCVPACQQIQAVVIESDPAIVPADTGYIDVCPGERIQLRAEGRYPQDGVVYEHSDLTSTFEWDFGDGGIAYGPTVTHAYEESGGYTVQLTITDQLGCRNTNFISQRVRVSTQPDFNIGGILDDEICVNDTVNLTTRINQLDPTRNISVQSTEGSFPAGGVRSDSLALPDGTGTAYKTNISFSDFAPGQTLNSIDDLLGICINIEHSWMRDLEISITCPAGNTIVLHDHPGNTGSGVYLGEPTTADGVNPRPGLGYDYCWTPSAPDVTWIEWANRNDAIGFETLPQGDYASFESLEDLLGCPLNGEWTISVADLWGQDNGFIFSWSIDFDPKLYPSIEIFQPEIVDYRWEENPTVFMQTPDSISASPQTAGSAAYRFTVTDDFGCAYDTSLVVDILPQTHPDCYSCAENVTAPADTSICNGEVVQLNVAPTEGNTEESVAFAAHPLYEFGATNHPPAIPYESKMAINSINPTIIGDPSLDIERVCFDIETDWAEDIEVILQTPTGVVMPLISNVGGAGHNFENTCFTPAATRAVAAATAPFTGDFRPAGDWNVLTGTPTNGEWTLLVSDAFGLTTFSKLKSWSITFRTVNEVAYSWDGGADLSCIDCPDPEFSPSETTTYTVRTSDSFGCEYSQDVQVNVVGDAVAPSVRCDVTDAFQLSYEWTSENATDTYEIRVNGGAWQTPNNGNNSHVLRGVVFNADNNIEVRVAGSENLNCITPTGNSTCRYDVCMLTAGIVGMPRDASCADATDGAVDVVANNGQRPYTYILDGRPAQSDSIFADLAPGMYMLTVRDATDTCEVSFDFEIFAPDALELSFTQTNPTCANFTNGVATVTAMGGTEPYTYLWSNNETTRQIQNIAGGDYTVTVTDFNGCMMMETISITEPDEFIPNIQVTGVSCNGETDGEAILNPAGGTAPYDYAWDNGTTGIQTQNLTAGGHNVTVTHANGCTEIVGFTIEEPVALFVQEINHFPTSCAGGSDGRAFVIVDGGTEPYTYEWSDDLRQNADTATFLMPGFISVTVMDANGCTVSADVTVGEPTELLVNTQRTDVNCNGGNDGTATAMPMGGTGPYNYQWSDDNSQTTQTASDLLAGNYTVTVIDNNGCETPTTVMIGEPSSAVTIASVEQTVRGCFGARAGEAEVQASGGTGAYTYEWADGQTTPTAINLDSIEQFITVTDANGCTAESSIVISDLEDITFSLINVPPTCFGAADGRMAVNNSMGGIGSGYTYQWSTEPTQTMEIAEGLMGDRSYTVTVTDAQGCVKAETRILEQPTAISFNVAGTDALCFGDSTGTASITDIVGDNNDFTYQWDLAAANQTTPTATDLPAGIYSVTIEDNAGCEATNEITIGQPTAVSTDFTITDNICFGDENGVVSVVATGGTPDYLYNWSTNETAAKIGTLLAGTYELTVTDANGCERVDGVEVTQPTSVTATLRPQDVTCFGDRDGSIEITPSGGTPPYLYSLDNENFNGSRTVVGLTADNYNIYIRDANGCEWFDVIDINTPPEFKVNIVGAGQRDVVAVGDSLQLFGEKEDAVGDVEYVWTAPVEGVLSCNECENTFVKPMNPLYVEVYAVDANGCEAEDRLQVMVEKDRVVLVPTGFTPDGNSRNDKLMVHGAEGSMIKTFKVFDRWGELMYENLEFSINDLEAGWDGNFRNSPAPAGIYVWYLEVEYIDGVTETLKGSTTLIR